MENTASTVISLYRVKSGRLGDFSALLSEHLPLLDKHGLLDSSRPSQRYAGRDCTGGDLVVEIFTWQPQAWHAAHENPEVMALWKRMADHCEDREGYPAMDFPHVAPLA